MQVGTTEMAAEITSMKEEDFHLVPRDQGALEAKSRLPQTVMAAADCMHFHTDSCLARMYGLARGSSFGRARVPQPKL